MATKIISSRVSPDVFEDFHKLHKRIQKRKGEQYSTSDLMQDIINYAKKDLYGDFGMYCHCRPKKPVGRPIKERLDPTPPTENPS
jgi:hypothetical protein